MIDVINGLSDRTHKVRSSGLTHVLEKGLGLCAVKDMLTVAGDYIDIVKLGWGTSAVQPEKLLRKKIKMYQRHNIYVTTGGTLAEVAVTRHLFDQFLEWAHEMGFDAIEVSDGTIEMDIDEKIGCIKDVQRAGFKVLAEVGKKDASAEVVERQWLEEARRLMEIPYCKVVMEARESGTVGIYNKDGSPKEDFMSVLASKLGGEISRVIWEAPQKAQQSWFIKRFGANINLGNISTDDVIALETLRRGLRSDTLSYFHNPKSNA